MSHTVNIKRRIITTTTTTRVTSGSVMAINSDYVKTIGGALQLLETLVGIIVVGLSAGSASRPDFIALSNPVIYLLIIAATCLITTFLMFMSCLFHAPTGESLPKTMFDLVYNCFAFFMYLAGGIAVLVTVHTDRYGGSRYNELLVAGIFAIINTIFYLAGAIISYKRNVSGESI